MSIKNTIGLLAVACVAAGTAACGEPAGSSEAFGRSTHFAQDLTQATQADRDFFLGWIDGLQWMVRQDPDQLTHTDGWSGDYTQDGVVTNDDLIYFVEDHLNSAIGDANLDGHFDSGDLVRVFNSAKYETGAVAGWADGDWNSDGLFDSSDVVFALDRGGYEG